MKGYLLFFLLLLLILTSCGREDAETKPMPETDQTLGVEEFTPGLPVRQVIIDTDMAVDDWFAILYLLKKPEVNVLAITVTGTGEAHCDPGVKNALGLVKLADHDPVPVACGVETPLKGNNVFPDSFRDSVDSMLGIQLPKGKNPASASDAVELMAEVLKNTSEPMDILVLGPQTNLANFVTDHPDLKYKVNEIYLMGGAVNVPGNVAGWIEGNTSAEWNIFIDPYAANQVFSSGIPIVMVGLDATNQCPLTMQFYESFKASASTPEAKFVMETLEKMQSFIESGKWYFWDPMAAAIMLDESLATYEDQPIHVIEDSGAMLGATVISQDAPIIKVAVSADGERFSREFIQTLNNK